MSRQGGFTVEGLDRLLRKLRNIGEDGPQVFQQFLEKCGFDFLDVVQDQIISMQVVDTRLMLNSFNKSGQGNVWDIQRGGLQLEIGTNVKYARYVNDGHWTTPNGVAQRWVPGSWEGSTFTYDPSATDGDGNPTGMLLKRKFVRGKPYWDDAVAIYETMFARDFQRLLDYWLRDEWRR